MASKNCLVIATSLGSAPGSIIAAFGKDGTASSNEAQWKCFDSWVSAQRWAAEHRIVVDGKSHVIMPHVPINCCGPLDEC
jgi:hypothetical protein